MPISQGLGTRKSLEPMVIIDRHVGPCPSPLQEITFRDNNLLKVTHPSLSERDQHLVNVPGIQPKGPDRASKAASLSTLGWN